MGLFNALSRAAQAYAQDVAKDFQRFRNRPALEALMASYALVAAADGYISPEERRKVVSLLQSSPVFGVFNTDTAVILFNRFAGAIQADPQIGRMNICIVLNRFRSDPEVARTIIRLCIMLAEKPEEKEVVRMICRELDERPESFPELRQLGQVRMLEEPRAMPDYLRREYEQTWPVEEMERAAENQKRNGSYRCPSPNSSGFASKDLKDFFDE